MFAVACPLCGQTDQWQALEQQQWATPVRLYKSNTHIEVEMSPSAEMVRELASSTTLMYFCSNESCGYSCSPEGIEQLISESSIASEAEVSMQKALDQRRMHEERQAEQDQGPLESPVDRFKRVFANEE